MLELTDYRVQDVLGEGGMATVYLAIHQRLARPVALKIMSPHAGQSKTFQRSFITEGRIIAKLEHPHIIKIYDINAQNGQFYMAMELLRKGNLKQRLANGKLPLSNALRITSQIADALSYAHQQGYIHRDIKPSNIMFRDNGHAVLTDFGIAKLQGTVSEMTQMGYIAGTPYYMAPEQSTGQYPLSPQADIYSLAIVFYEMLTGEKPFTGTNTIAIGYEHVHSPIPLLEGEASLYQTVLDKALAKHPAERFANMNDFTQALLAAAQTEAKTLLLPQPQTNIQPSKRFSIYAVGGLMGVLIGLGFAGFSFWHTKQEQSTQQERINALVEHAKLLEQQRRIFNHTQWSEGCKQYLISRDGPYEAQNSSQWYYEKIVELEPNSKLATAELERIQRQIQLDYQQCDQFKLDF